MIGAPLGCTRGMKKILSYGGGLDSFAMLLDGIARGEKPDVCVFMDVSDGSADANGTDPGEWLGTYRHIREIVMPLCAREGIEFVWIDTRTIPVRNARSLFTWMEERGQIPVAGPNRICTIVAKVERFETWMAQRFPGGEPVEVWIGFEAGEESRTEKDPNAGKPSTQRKNRFPLQERGLCRCRCEALVRAAGYPVPRKSACVFCPYGSKNDWKTFARELPEQFAKVVALEANKPPTKKNGIKLSIMGFSSRKRADGTQVRKATPLPEFVVAPSRPSKPKPCGVCGAAERATKATACGYLEEGLKEAV